jgi:hypothetical protein
VNNNLLVHLLFCLPLFILAPQTKADSLLLVTSVRQSWKSGTAAGENAIGVYAKYTLNKKYRKIYWWCEFCSVLRQPSGLSLLQRIVAERLEGERLDVVSVQHGPDRTFMPDVDPKEIERLLPVGFIRSLFSTGCNMYGLSKIDPESGQATINRFYFPTHLANLGVDEFILYTGINTSFPTIANSLFSAIRSPGSWLTNLIPVMRKVDEISTAQINRLRVAIHNSEWTFPFLFRNVIAIYPASRPVFGVRGWDPQVFKTFDSHLVPIRQLNQYGEEYTEALLPYSTELQTAVRKICPTLIPSAKRLRLNTYTKSLCYGDKT